MILVESDTLLRYTSTETGQLTTRLRQFSCPIAQGNHFLVLGNHDLQKNCLTGQVQIESKLTSILPQKLQTMNIFQLFNFTHIFCYSGTFGQAVYGQACPIGQPRKKKIVTAWRRLSSRWIEDRRVLQFEYLGSLINSRMIAQLKSNKDWQRQGTLPRRWWISGRAGVCPWNSRYDFWEQLFSQLPHMAASHGQWPKTTEKELIPLKCGATYCC